MQRSGSARSLEDRPCKYDPGRGRIKSGPRAMRIWPFTDTSASPPSERMDYDRVIAGAPSGAHIITPFSMLHRSWSPSLLPPLMLVPIHPGCSNKINNEGSPSWGRKGLKGEEEGFIFFSLGADSPCLQCAHRRSRSARFLSLSARSTA